MNPHQHKTIRKLQSECNEKIIKSRTDSFSRTTNHLNMVLLEGFYSHSRIMSEPFDNVV